MPQTDTNPPLPAVVEYDWRVLYSWFSGWRWELRREGEVVDESLECFESEKECRADVNRRRLAMCSDTPRDARLAATPRERLAA